MTIKYELFVDGADRYLGVAGQVYDEGDRGWRLTQMTYPSCLKFMPWAEVLGAGEVADLSELGISKGPAPGPPPRPGLEWKEETSRWIRPDGSTIQTDRQRNPHLDEDGKPLKEAYSPGTQATVVNSSNADLQGAEVKILGTHETKGVLVDTGEVKGWMDPKSLKPRVEEESESGVGAAGVQVGQTYQVVDEFAPPGYRGKEAKVLEEAGEVLGRPQWTVEIDGRRATISERALLGDSAKEVEGLSSMWGESEEFPYSEAIQQSDEAEEKDAMEFSSYVDYEDSKGLVEYVEGDYELINGFMRGDDSVLPPLPSFDIPYSKQRRMMEVRNRRIKGVQEWIKDIGNQMVELEPQTLYRGVQDSEFMSPIKVGQILSMDSYTSTSRSFREARLVASGGKLAPAMLELRVGKGISGATLDTPEYETLLDSNQGFEVVEVRDLDGMPYIVGEVRSSIK